MLTALLALAMTGQYPSPQAAALTAPPAAPQTVTLQITAAPVAIQPGPITATVRHPGPIGRTVGNFGLWLSRAGHSRVLIPAASVTVHQAAYVVTQPAAPVVMLPAAPPAAADTVGPPPAVPSPQAAGSLLFGQTPR